MSALEDVQPDTRSRADLLVRWMCARGRGSFVQFIEAIEYLYGDAADRGDVYEAARLLSALGFAEFDSSGDMRWRFVPPSVYGAVIENHAVLQMCGIPSEEFQRDLAARGITVGAEASAFICDDEVTRRYLPDGMVVRGLIDNYGMMFSPLAAKDLRLRLPSVSELVLEGEPVPPPTEAQRYAPTALRFGDEAPVIRPYQRGLYRVGYPRPTYLWLSVTEDGVVCRRVDPLVGMWAALRETIPRPARYFGSTLRLPAVPSLPPLYERLLYFFGARCISNGSDVRTFDRVPREAVTALTQRLPLEKASYP